MTDFSHIEQIKKIVEEVILRMGIIDAKVDYEESLVKGLVFNISSLDSKMLIGRQGSHLYALQTIVRDLAFKKLPRETIVRFSLDVDDYKMKREWFLKETARAVAADIIKTGRSQELEPMPAFERRLIHAFLQENFSDLESFSVGADPYRKVIIRRKQ